MGRVASDGLQRIRIDLAYDGQPFAGFARQPELETVQGTLEGALSRATDSDADVVCAGRTDAGVHALAQVVHVDLDPSRRRSAAWLQLLDEHPESVRFRLDHQVGRAIAIMGVRRVADDFHARFSATERRYRYRLVDGGVADPRLRGMRWHVSWGVDVDAMDQAASHLLGEHDFASLCRKAPGRHTVRRIDQISVERRRDEVQVKVRGRAFCHQQVRSIVGCLVEIGRGSETPAWMATVLNARDRAVAAPVAPAHGLTLEAVAYGGGHPDAPWRT